MILIFDFLFFGYKNFNKLIDKILNVTDYILISLKFKNSIFFFF